MTGLIDTLKDERAEWLLPERREQLGRPEIQARLLDIGKQLVAAIAKLDPDNRAIAQRGEP